MTVQKFITYSPVDIHGKKLDFQYDLTLKVSETLGNYLVHKDLLRHFRLQQQGTVSTKTKSEVQGGGRKPWRQKGTGRARAGSNRSPLWKGGGVIFGPKPKKSILKSNKKERQLALQTVLYNKKKNSLIIENLETAICEIKTKAFLKVCQDCSINLQEKILVVVFQKTNAMKRSTQNLPNVELISISSLNTFSLLKAKQIIFSESAINYLKENYCD
jgi:large subunit ribosomal protein L4